MALLWRYPSTLSLEGAYVVATLGMFDGLHLGHQKILKRMQEIKRAHKNARAIMISFYPHPALVLGKAASTDRITSTRQMLSLVDKFEVDVLYLVRFTKQISNLSAADFLKSCLYDKLNVASLVVGEDARFGKGGEGHVEFLRQHLPALNKQLEVVNFLKEGDQKISSSSVRQLLVQGNLETVELLLGRRFGLSGKVVHGDGRGGPLGTPTANIRPVGQVLPQNGVYATYVYLKGQRFRAATNVGVRPTFKSQGIWIESLLIDYSGAPFYGEHIEVEFVRRIRAEIKFSSLQELKQRILKDVADAGRILS